MEKEWITYGDKPNFHVVDGCKISAAVSAEAVERVKKLKMFPEDILIAGHPRSGNHWVGELCWLILHHGDCDRASHSFLTDRSPLIENHWPQRELHNIDYIEAANPPRIMKTHLQPQFFGEQMNDAGFKMIYVLRNPKDMLVSLYHHHQIFFEYKGTWDEFFKWFQEDDLPHENVFVTITRWWKLRSDPNILYIHYEEIKKDTARSVRKLADHLGVSLSQSQVSKIVKYATVENMKNNMRPIDTWLIRKGKVGGWREYFSPEQEDIINGQMKEFEEQHGVEFLE